MLSVFVGPMFSGKTSRLAWELERAAFVYKGRALYVTHAADAARSADAESVVATSHSALTAAGARRGAAPFDLARSARLSDVCIDGYVAVGIDEGQFFAADDLVRAVSRILARNIQCIVVGLDGDYRQEPFPSSGLPALLPIADGFKKLKSAVCRRCQARGAFNVVAPFTAKVASADVRDPIGGGEKWEAVCRPCLAHSSE